MNEQELKVKDVSTETLKKIIEMREDDPHAECKKAFAEGKEVEIRYANGEWYKTKSPSWSIGKKYRIADPYAECKKAFAEGKEIEWYNSFSGEWVIDRHPNFNFNWEYRIADPYRKFREAQERGEPVWCKRANGKWHSNKDSNTQGYWDFNDNCEYSLTPPVKKINHEMLVESQVLCEFTDNCKFDNWFRGYGFCREIYDETDFNYGCTNGDDYRYMRVAFDIPQVHTGNKCPVPEGYMVSVRNANGVWHVSIPAVGLHWGECGNMTITAYKVTGIAEGWEL